MSAIAIYRTDDAIVLASDGAAYDNLTGRVMFYCTKVTAMPDLGAVVGAVGAGQFCIALQVALRDYQVTTFEGLLKILPATVKRVYELLQAQAGHWPIHATVVVAGYSAERERFETHQIRTRDKEVWDGAADQMIVQPGWTLHEMDPFWVSTWPGDEITTRFGINAGQPPLDLTARAICACRSMSNQIDAEDNCYAVGGFLQMTIVKRETIATWIAHRWPDPLGETINPAQGEPMPAFPLDLPW